MLEQTSGRQLLVAGLCAMAPGLPAVACATVLGLDAVQFSRWWTVLITGLLDEPAHLLTAGLFLAALAPRRSRLLVPWALAGSVLIDLDHVPLYTRWADVAAEGGRPVTHSLATLGVLALVALLVPRFRRGATGLALGVALHFIRDLATGPGVPLFAPWEDGGVRVPYACYAVALFAVTTIATVRWWRWGAVSFPQRDGG